MSTTGARASKIVGSVLVVCASLLAMGCGPAPGYEPEPRVPGTYEPPPAPAEELAAQPPPEARAQGELEAHAQEQGGAGAELVQAQAGDIAIGASADEYADTDPSALTEWKPVLENHGAWVDDSTYGTLWVPSQNEVGSDFQPYVTAGHWTYGDTENWVWVSDYDWGWVPFHYGRWVYLPARGWAWIPGRVYSGAWVEWRTGSYGYEYVGWAPMGPSWYWWGGYAVGWSFGWYHPRYVYCHHDYLYHPHFGGHVVYGGTPAAGPIEGHTQPFHPASPGVAGTGRIVATPGVGGAGRVTANPGVGGGVGGGSNTRIAMGPKPGDLGIRSELVARPPAGDKQLARAQAFASPNTAKPLGALPPAQVQVRPRRVQPEAMAGAPGHALSPSSAARLEPAARAPGASFTGSSPSRPMTDATPFSRGTSPGASQRFSGPSAPSAPFYRAPPSAPVYRSSPSVHAAPSAPTFRGGSGSSFSPSPSFHSSTPSVSTHSSSPSRSAPSVSRGSSGRRR